MRCRWLLCTSAVVIGIGFAGWSADLSAQTSPIPSSPASISAGRLVFAKNCRPCHGLKGEGDGVAAPPGSKPANLAAGKLKHGDTDAAIFKTIKEGVGPEYDMQAWDGKISDTDIWNTINFIRDLQAKRAASKPAAKGAPKKK
jgi:mono/diheme cytochrome c family protein